MKRFVRANSQSALLYFEAYQVDNIGELVANNLTHKYRSEGADFHYVSGKQGYNYDDGTNSITIRCRVSSHYDPEINKNSRYGAYLDSMDFKEFEASHTFRYNRYDTQDSMGRQLVINLTDDIEDQIFKAVNGDITATTNPNVPDACDKVMASTNDPSIVNKIYSVMMNYEYGYDPDMTDINSMLQELTKMGVRVDTSSAFKTAWVSAHNKAESKTWGDSGDSMQYDSLTPEELDAIENYDTEYWEYAIAHPFKLTPKSAYEVSSSTKYGADMCSIGASEGTNGDTRYVIYFNDPDEIADVDSDLQGAITKLKGWINDAIADGTIESINLADCQVTSVSETVDEDGDPDFDWDTEQVEYCADADEEYAKYVNATTKSGEHKQSIKASSHDNRYDDNGNLYKYAGRGYLQQNLVGLMDEIYSNDFQEVLDYATEMSSGLYIELQNQITGASVVVTPEDWDEASEYGEYPTKVYTIV